MISIFCFNNETKFLSWELVGGFPGRLQDYHVPHAYMVKLSSAMLNNNIKYYCNIGYIYTHIYIFVLNNKKATFQR